ncbi:MULTISPECIES: glycoside hydrolase family 15 protein [unclassified Rhizobium]|uniref:glycoside hydrolase family 15 protein n=1 Tax=unclassified Rhizobium TaxID=2613769 RepID=UPI0007EB2571|nr:MULTISPECIES: glycoside hydrolase family 15 protein [unclassified Rhizobium]ANK88734.1 glycosyde hydrolase family 15 protein [Rhizobium sp. N731]ANL18987.1 glycosyde hydrolase family 15 protein [Rhizobium sp. N1314]
MVRRIEDYGLIGNMLSAALVGKDGSIDWLCLPRFDSPACFAAVLGTPDNGRWRIAPVGKGVKTSRRYLPDTAILETRFETPTGAATLTDFMPISETDRTLDVIRIVTGVSGTVEMDMELVLRFENGQAVPWVRRKDYGLSAVAGPHAIELHTALPIEGRNMKTCARFRVTEGESVPLTLSYHASNEKPHFVADRREVLGRTAIWWREWVKRGSFEDMPDIWREPVVRSLITLKMLIYAPTGAIVAAPTTSLPEKIGGTRNWDYRYCWLRDSALTLYALLNSGYRKEAEDWRQWLLRAVAGSPDQLQIMYGIGGERWLPEVEVPWLEGFERSTPVRIGNKAAEQVQIDVFGELIDTLHAARDAELQPRDEAWRLQKVLLRHLESAWHIPDRGIWEVRGPARSFTHSRLMAWVAFDRAVIGVERYGLEGPIAKWRELRQQIHDDICTNGFDAGKNSFVQYYGGDTIDASLLLMPQLGFLAPDDPRIIGTIAAIERDLLQTGLVLRYSTDETDDGVGGREGAFLACSFWLADAYVLANRGDDARELFDHLLDLRNDLGLLAEEYNAATSRLLGNFPQAFSHIGLINTAHNLVSAGGPARQRARKTAPSKPTKVSDRSSSHYQNSPLP